MNVHPYYLLSLVTPAQNARRPRKLYLNHFFIQGFIASIFMFDYQAACLFMICHSYGPHYFSLCDARLGCIQKGRCSGKCRHSRPTPIRLVTAGGGIILPPAKILPLT
jgi:hypothetical protein